MSATEIKSEVFDIMDVISCLFPKRGAEVHALTEEMLNANTFTSTPCFVVESYSDQDNGLMCNKYSVLCPKCLQNAEVCHEHLIDGVCVECAE